MIDDHKMLAVYKTRVIALEKKVTLLENIINDTTRAKEDSEITMAQLKV